MNGNAQRLRLAGLWVQHMQPPGLFVDQLLPVGAQVFYVEIIVFRHLPNLFGGAVVGKDVHGTVPVREEIDHVTHVDRLHIRRIFVRDKLKIKRL